MSWNKAGVRFFLGNVHIFTWSLQKVVLPGQILYIEKKGGSVTSMECFFFVRSELSECKRKGFPPQKRFFRATWNSVTWTSLETVNIVCGLPLSFCPWPEFLVYCICMLFLVSVQKIIFCIYCGLFLPSRDLLAQSQQWAQENNL